MNKFFPITSLILSFLPAACTDDEPSVSGLDMPLVVEGWIEEGMPPVVMVTHAIDLTGENASFDGFVEKWARVSIYDGDRQYLLTGRNNSDYVPSFIYTSSRLHGQTGHTYRLVVETETDTVEAVATMLPAPAISRIESVPVEGSDTLFSLRAYVDGITPEGYYKFFSTTVGLEKRDYGTFMGTFAGNMYRENEGWIITRGIYATYDDSREFSHYYTLGSRVTVKLASISHELYDFWNVYDSNISLSQNLLFTFAGNCPTNIKGGLGYWAAYGTGRMTVRVGK